MSSAEIPSPDDIAVARERVAPWIRRTPVIALARPGFELAPKLELLQHTGSFKPRGAFNAMLSGAYRPSRGERIVSLVCGANCDPATVTG